MGSAGREPLSEDLERIIEEDTELQVELEASMTIPAAASIPNIEESPPSAARSELVEEEARTFFETQNVGNLETEDPEDEVPEASARLKEENPRGAQALRYMSQGNMAAASSAGSRPAPEGVSVPPATQAPPATQVEPDEVFIEGRRLAHVDEATKKVPNSRAQLPDAKTSAAQFAAAKLKRI